MQTSFAIALLAVSTQALQMPAQMPADMPAQMPADMPADLAQQTSTSCEGYEGFSNTQSSNDMWGETFQGPSDWFNSAGQFWQYFTLETAFQYFDCEYGNGDGRVDFTEVNTGLFDGKFTPDFNCSADYFADFQETFNTSGIAISEGQFQDSFNEEFSNQVEGMMTGTTSLNHNDWMRNAMNNLNVSAEDAQLWWQAANVGSKKNKNVVTKNEMNKMQGNQKQGLWDFAEEQMIALGDYMPSDLWYVTKGCASGEQWWSALTNDKNSTSWSNNNSYDITAWQTDHCRNMGMCRNGATPECPTCRDSDSDNGSDSDSESDSDSDSESDN